MRPEAWLFLGTCVTAAIGLIGVIVTLRTTRSQLGAAAKTEAAKNDVARDALVVEKRTAEVENLRNAMGTLAEHLERVEGWHEECEQRCTECKSVKTELQAENRTLRAQVAGLEQRVDELEAERG